MIFLVILTIIMAFIMLGQGILLLFSNKWLPKLSILMWSKPLQPSSVLKISIWRLRVLGIVNVMLSISIFITVAVPHTNVSILFAIALIAIITYILLGLVVFLIVIKSKKTSKNKSSP
jgi:hypothetical protein